MAETTVVHLLRHGEVFNPEKVLYGRLPGYLLSETGEAMALAAAEWLSDKGITRVVSSPLERAQQTAAPIAGKLDLPIEVDDRLIEAGNAFEGLRVGVGDGALRSPQHWWKLRNPFRPSWGEPYVEIAARMLAAVESARDAARGAAAVCVSHQLPIWTLRLHLEGRRYTHDPRRRECGLASVTSVTYDGDRVAGISYAEPAGATDPDAVPGA
ncbi:histidine phosphatase family protein [Geodermatophilus obscurus]|uniref:Phosphoglycerate mutase n=1 Tax=Geodermatophilus obscurus (strain ATCC 25078 / DSM 43160 / JCM 3152 / CCUG 61914 / KCC A-0152 / KCTC 9177 / NBRC 13315 / NRRL B-3577 / G-20) TaxID=526225 RepID=D2SHH0_GEOOG|nr:histidine phosphatase family protein [Geodermatophilus obscurus]ADB77124.1 Phosphoglycerate mutase [Geodermatophilus obscurus DSM 43160]